MLPSLVACPATTGTKRDRGAPEVKQTELRVSLVPRYALPFHPVVLHVYAMMIAELAYYVTLGHPPACDASDDEDASPEKGTKYSDFKDMRTLRERVRDAKERLEIVSLSLSYVKEKATALQQHAELALNGDPSSPGLKEWLKAYLLARNLPTDTPPSWHKDTLRNRLNLYAEYATPYSHSYLFNQQFVGGLVCSVGGGGGVVGVVMQQDGGKSLLDRFLSTKEDDEADALRRKYDNNGQPCVYIQGIVACPFYSARPCASPDPAPPRAFGPSVGDAFLNHLRENIVLVDPIRKATAWIKKLETYDNVIIIT